MNIQEQMFADRSDDRLMTRAKEMARAYLDNIHDMDVFPNRSNLDRLSRFHEPFPHKSGNALEVLEQLQNWGSAGTVAQAGGRYFGFVNGGAIPVTIGVKWLSDVWDQCGGLYLTSPLNAHLESVCETWLRSIFKLPEQTVAGFVSGTSMANLCGLAAARFHLLQAKGWDVNEQGLNGAPSIRVIAHEQVHASVKKTLSVLGFGSANLETIKADDQGRLDMSTLPVLDDSCLILMQAGNVNTGAFDPFDSVCDLANSKGAWVHIDGAFGLWAAAANSFQYLTRGLEKADSWAVDGHKTLNTPYDSGIIMCKHPKALVRALQATSDYITLSEDRDPMLFTPEMSKRSRAIELWAALKYLGSSGIDQLVTMLHQHARKFEHDLSTLGFTVLNQVVFNQVLIRAETDDMTRVVLDFVQQSGTCWLSGTVWQNKPAIRISVCSWVTTQEDIDKTVDVFAAALATAQKNH